MQEGEACADAHDYSCRSARSGINVDSGSLVSLQSGSIFTSLNGVNSWRI